MAINFLNNVQFNTNQLLSAVVENLGSDPASGSEGQIYFNTSDDVLKMYANGAWVEVGGGALESVGLSMPSAFSVSNSPVTGTSGTLTVTGAGTTAQYIDGSGALQTFPTIPTNIVETLVTTDGTYISLTPTGTPVDGNVTVTADLSAVDGTSTTATRFLSKDNTWDVPSYTSGGVTAFSSASGTYIDIDTNTNATGSVDIGTVDLNAVDGTSTTSTKFLSKDNTWDVPSYTTDTNTTYDLSKAAASEDLILKADGVTQDTITFKGSSNQINLDVSVADQYTYGFPSGGFIAPDGSTATTQSNNDASGKLATTNYVDNMIGTIPSGLSYEGTWDASSGSAPSASPSNGQFWIVSVDGSTSLSGITDWKVGDWAIYVEQGAGSDGWQKVDNTSILSGAGGASGRVTFWSGQTTLTNDADFSYNNGTNVLTVGGGNSTEWDEAYDNYVVSAAVTGTSSKTMTFTQNDGGTFTATWTDEDGVESINVTSPIVDTGTATAPNIGINNASGTTPGAAAVDAGTGITVSDTGGVYTVSVDSSTNVNGVRLALGASSGPVTANGSSGGETSWTVDCSSASAVGASDAKDVKCEVISAAGETVYPDITRSSANLTISFTDLPSAPSNNDYEVLLLKI